MSTSQSRTASAILLLLKLRAVLVLVVLLIAFSAMAPSFLTANNLSILAKLVRHLYFFAVTLCATCIFLCKQGEGTRKKKNQTYY